MSQLYAGYMPNGRDDIDYATGTATFTEIFDVHYYDNDTEFSTSPSVAKFYTSHFSGYALASGAKPTTSRSY